MPEPDEDLELLVVQALEAFDRDGESGLAALLASHGDHAERVRTIVGRMVQMGLVGGTATAVLPEHIGGYQVKGAIGRGGMGVVYEVVDAANGQRLAMKVVRTELLAQEHARERFEREILALSRVQHPAVVPIVASGVDRGLPFYVMPRLDGGTLDEAVAKLGAAARPTGADLWRAIGGRGDDVPPAFDGEYWRACVRLLQPVAAGLDHAHRRGVVHRDVKPANVLVTTAGQAVLVDFGLAQVRGAVRLTRTGIEPGSPLYMAPEQLRGEPPDERTDVYGLAITLWHCLLRRAPFADGDEVALAQRIASGAAAPLPTSAAPPELRLVLATAIDRERARRHASAAALAADLDAVLHGRPVAARPLPLPVRWRRFVQRHRAAAAAAGTLLVLLPVLLSVLLLREQKLGSEVRAQQQRADAKIREFDLLAGVVRHARALALADELHPAWPDRLPAIEHWLTAVAAPLLAMRPEIERVVATLGPTATDPAGSARFLVDTLAELSQKLETLRTTVLPDVQGRRRWAQFLSRGPDCHPAARHTWSAVRRALASADDVVASRAYRRAPPELRDVDVLGLVPIGMNPVTKLWEFYDLRSAWDGRADPCTLPIPQHQADGTIRVDEDLGIVFVLLPAAATCIGASRDPQGANHDPAADDDAPPTTVELASFFCARHELTQAQWARLSADYDPLRWPSHYAGGKQYVDSRITLAHPVEHVSWQMAELLLRRHGLLLPTEAQWEYAARAGTTTPWWCGAEPEDLRGNANVLDAGAAAAIPQWAPGDSFDDGFVLHAPVGSFAANPFGLHDVHGNVWEWCRDRWGSFGDPARAGDGYRDAGDSPNRAARGGCFSRRAESARSSVRFHWDPSLRSGEVGVRPVRALRRT